MRFIPWLPVLAALLAPAAAQASPSGVVISQVYGGGGNSGAVYKQDFIELFNAGPASVAIGGWSVQYASATGTSWALTAIPAGVTLQPGQYYLLRQAGGTGGTTDVPGDLLNGTLAMSGTTGKVALVRNTTALNGASPTAFEDLIAWGPTATGAEGGAPAALLTNTTAHARAASGCTDTDRNAADFAAGAPLPRNTRSPLNACGGVLNAPIVPNCPDQVAVAGAASSFTVSATDADSRVTAATLVGNLPTGLSLGRFDAATGDGAPATQAFTVGAHAAAGSYTLGLSWANDEAQTASCSVKLSVSGLVTIPAIQGSAARSPMDGSTITTRGIVTHRVSNGFYLQDPDGDGDPATSDGIFVFTSSAPTVVVGDQVTVSAKVLEYSVAASAASLANPLTELTNVSAISVISSGNALPLPVEVSLATVASTTDMERYEGMLVRITDTLTVNQTNFVGSWGQLTVSAGGRTLTPTNVLRPGPAALALQAANLARSIVLDDSSATKFPNPTPYLWQDGTVRAGDTVSGVTGVVDFGPSTDAATGPLAYRIHPTAAPAFARPSARPVVPPLVGGNVRVASANVLNFFTTFTDGSAVPGGGSTCTGGCRGADNLHEFNRQRTKILAALAGLNADVVGLMEIQNNGNFAVQHLVAGLNALLGPNTYAAVPLPTVVSAGGAGTGTDAIRVAMIYQPGRVSLAGPALADTQAVQSRPPLAQGFLLPNGEKFAVIVNHFKSKGSCGSGANGDTGDLQGCWNLLRQQQAQRLLDWLPSVTATAATDRILLIGDFNAYAQEDPIDLLKRGGLVDLVSRFDPADHSYIFDAAAGRLDHGLGTAAIAAQVTGAGSWHINADEPEWTDYNTEDKAVGNDWYQPTAFRASDHDPLLIGLQLVKRVTGGAGSDTLVGSPGDDVIEGGPGRDTLSGNGGRDQFVFRTGADGLDTITDFKPGLDKLVFTDLLRSVGITSATPLATGHVTCTQHPDGALVGYDPDGAAGAAASRPVVKLRTVACTALNAASFQF